MVRVVALPLAAALHAQSSVATSASVSPAERIGQVVDTLKDVLHATENEERDEAQNFKCYMQWCEGEIENKEKEVDDNEDQLEQLRVAVNSHVAAEKRYEYQIDSNQGDAEEIADGIQAADAIRAQENRKFDSETSIQKQSISQVDKAIEIVQRQGELESLLQQNKTRATVKRLRTLTQMSEPGESSMVLGVMQSLKNNLERNLGLATDTEEKKQAMHDRLLGSKKIQLTEINSDTEKKQILLAETKSKLSQARSDIGTTNKDLEEDKQYLEDVSAECEAKQKDWTIRSNDRAQEKAAIREAISYLTLAFSKEENQEKKAAALLASQRQAKALDAAFDPDSVESFVQLDSDLELGLDGEQFAEVKKTINELIRVTHEEQSAADDKFKQCQHRKEKNEESLQSLEEASDRLDALVNKKVNMVQQLTQEVEEINSLMSEKKEADATAKRLRKEGAASYDKSAKENALAMTVLREARRVLANFYKSKDTTALSQLTSAAAPKTWDGSSRKSGENNIVLAMIDKIIDDLKIEIKEAREEEDEEVAAYAKYVGEAKVEFNARMALITEKVTRKAKLEVQLSTAREDQDTTREQLVSVQGQIASWRSTCEDHLSNHKKDSEQRGFEVSQLRDAHDILSGSTEAVRTAMLAIERVGQLTADDE